MSDAPCRAGCTGLAGSLWPWIRTPGLPTPRKSVPATQDHLSIKHWETTSSSGDTYSKAADLSGTLCTRQTAAT